MVSPCDSILWLSSNSEANRIVADRLTSMGRLVEIRKSAASEPVLQEGCLVLIGLEEINHVLDGRCLRKNGKSHVQEWQQLVPRAVPESESAVGKTTVVPCNSEETSSTQEKKTSSVTEAELQGPLIRQLLETPFWPDGLKPREHYFRTHDDCDGEDHKGVTVLFSDDGDAHIVTPREGCRFRTFAGGGQSPRVRNALIILALAIKADNEEKLF